MERQTDKEFARASEHCDGKKLSGVIGYPIAHTLSPLIHQTVYDAAGLAWHYGRFECSDITQVFSLVNGAHAHANRFLGFNVTMPYKRDVMNMVDGLDASAFMVGGANVLCFEEGISNEGFRLVGYNTDGYGVLRTLELDANCNVAGKTVAICGTGAAALSALVSLAIAGARAIFLVSRHVEQAHRLIMDRQKAIDEAALLQEGFLTSGFGPEQKLVSWAVSSWGTAHVTRMEAISYQHLDSLMPDIDILIDATPLGMNPDDPSVVASDLIRSHHTILDVVYGQGETALRRACAEAGACSMDGLGMLVEQAIATMHLFADAQGVSLLVDRTMIYEALRDSLM